MAKSPAVSVNLKPLTTFKKIVCSAQEIAPEEHEKKNRTLLYVYIVPKTKNWQIKSVSMQQTCQDINKPPALMLVQIKSSDHIDASNKPTCSGSQLIVSQN